MKVKRRGEKRTTDSAEIFQTELHSSKLISEHPNSVLFVVNDVAAPASMVRNGKRSNGNKSRYAYEISLSTSDIFVLLSHLANNFQDSDRLHAAGARADLEKLLAYAIDFAPKDRPKK
jgi:hypothetical protein